MTIIRIIKRKGAIIAISTSDCPCFRHLMAASTGSKRLHPHGGRCQDVDTARADQLEEGRDRLEVVEERDLDPARWSGRRRVCGVVEAEVDVSRMRMCRRV